MNVSLSTATISFLVDAIVLRRCGFSGKGSSVNSYFALNEQNPFLITPQITCTCVLTNCCTNQTHLTYVVTLHYGRFKLLFVPRGYGNLKVKGHSKRSRINWSYLCLVGLLVAVQPLLGVYPQAALR